MSSYKKVLILHAIDNSTAFLSVFKEEFKELYFPFDSCEDSINKAKGLIGDLEPKSLIIYLGHGSSLGLYEPDESHTYEKYFLDATWGNHYFDEHDIFLLSCKSKDYVKKIYKSNFSLGFGNIISSKFELDKHNEQNDVKLVLDEIDISKFNNIYINSSIMVIKKLIKDEINFFDIPKYLRFLINKEINNLLLDKNNKKRIYISKLLFNFRNEVLLKKNPH